MARRILEPKKNRDREYIAADNHNKERKVWVDANANYMEVICYNEAKLVEDLMKHFNEKYGVGTAELNPNTENHLPKKTVLGEETSIKIKFPLDNKLTVPHSDKYNGMDHDEQEAARKAWKKAQKDQLNEIESIIIQHDLVRYKHSKEISH